MGPHLAKKFLPHNVPLTGAPIFARVRLDGGLGAFVSPLFIFLYVTFLQRMG
jgi:hypothetical protein